jgi:predicted O-methyltransferase YrrM
MLFSQTFVKINHMTNEEALKLIISTKSDINEHLQFMHDIVVNNNAKTIVELGTRWGVSTIALLTAAEKTNGTVYSCDIDVCSYANENIRNLNLDKRWVFAVADDLLWGRSWSIPIDVLFIDTVHTQDQTEKELALFSTHMSPNGIILLHDTIPSEPNFGVMPAIEQWRMKNPDYTFEHRAHNNGLGVLRRIRIH